MVVGSAEIRRWLALYVSLAFCLVLIGGLVVAVLFQGAVIAKLWDRIERLDEEYDERAPCKGCFDSLKWRVDIHHPVQPGDPYEQTYGSRGVEEEAVRPPGGPAGTEQQPGGDGGVPD